MEDDKSHLSLINSSGFPFQIAVENLINKTESEHGWKVAGREHYWKDEDSGKDGFSDLIVSSIHYPYRAVIECKRDYEQSWIFLASTDAKEESFASLLWSKAISKNPESGRTVFKAWGRLKINPPSFVSAFCIVRGQSSKDRPMLERVASDVVLMVESLAEEDSGKVGTRINSFPVIYIPIIVTTAKLIVCKIQETDIDIHTGILPADKAEFSEVPFLQFKKGLQSNIDHGNIEFANITGKALDLTELNQMKQRSVFVVHSTEIVNFLKSFELQQEHWTSFYVYPWKSVEEVLKNPPSNL